ncbi:MAG: sugar kinase [Sphingomonadales bacterium]|nr:sugar kinase [Sphingomonadales bacterium]
MLEISRAGAAWQFGHGGDMLNTAIHLARAGHDVALLTALGTDPHSARLRAAWTAEGIDPALILTDPARNPGLYAIDVDNTGERSFTYWRAGSAASAMFALPAMAQASAVASRADSLVFSLISLAILPDAGREALLRLARAVREAGGKVAFDGNYRPRLWASPAEARHWRDAAIAAADFGLPTLDDEIALDGAGDALAVAAHWQRLGCAEPVVKLGAAGCRLADGAIIAPARQLAALDTSGAGDAFDAGYLGARLRGAPPAEAARQGHALAGWTIMRPGAIPPRE